MAVIVQHYKQFSNSLIIHDNLVNDKRPFHHEMRFDNPVKHHQTEHNNSSLLHT